MKRAIIVLCLAAGVGSCTTQPSDYEFGLQLYSLRDQFPSDVAGTLARVKAMGITEVETAGRYGLSPEKFRKLAEASGLRIVSTGTEFRYLESDPQAVADTAKWLGARYVVTFWIPHEGDTLTAGDTDRAIRVFNRAGRVMKENGLTFCYHPHGYEFQPDGSGGTLFDRLLTRTDTSLVSYEMDVFWIRQPGQDPVEILRKYPGRFKLMHLKDRLPGTPDSQDGHADVESNVVLGTGDVGIAEIMTVARGLGVRHFFIEDESSRAEQQIPESLKFLKSTVSGKGR
jgi:sugar phosphate isomerase/epimerase